jgi:hypothetical protein
MRAFLKVAAMTMVMACSCATARPVTAPPSEASAPRGEWYNTDLRGLEQSGTCARLWLEERTYAMLPGNAGRFTGVYRNVVRATPVGPPSFNPSCRYSPLVAGSGDDLSKTLVFRPAVPVPPAARAVLEDTVQRMEGGECLKVMSRLATRPDAAAQMCALRAKMSQFLGSYLSMSVDSMTEFDRVPDGFPVKPSTGWRRQRGVFFVFTGRYENQVIPGNAVVFEEAGEWRVVLLWF